MCHETNLIDLKFQYRSCS